MSDKWINNQIAVYKTNKKLCEFNDKLKAATVDYYAHIHAQGDGRANEEGTGKDSGGTGDKNVIVMANLSPEFFAYALSRVSIGVDLFEFYEEKIFGDPDAKGMSPVTRVSIKRASFGQDGKARNYPWCIQIENGRAVKEKTQQGGVHMKKGSYQKDNSVFVNINDYDFFKLMHQTTRYINAWELTNGPKRIREAQQLIEQKN